MAIGLRSRTIVRDKRRMGRSAASSQVLDRFDGLFIIPEEDIEMAATN
jgi:hypothetical protein